MALNPFNAKKLTKQMVYRHPEWNFGNVKYELLKVGVKADLDTYNKVEAVLKHYEREELNWKKVVGDMFATNIPNEQYLVHLENIGFAVELLEQDIINYITELRSIAKDLDTFGYTQKEK